MTRETMLRPLAEPLSLHPPEDSRQSSTAELDTMSCAAPVQEALQAGTCAQHVSNNAATLHCSVVQLQI